LTVLKEIVEHCKRGIDFYGKFVVHIANLQQNVNNFIAARELEKKDWIDYLDKQNP
jgi:hypothetical protein